MLTKSDALSRSSESMRQQRSISARSVSICELHRGAGRTRISQTEAIGGAPEGQQPTLGLEGPDESLQQLADILLDCELLRGGKELDHEIIETLGELGEEAQFWYRLSMQGLLLLLLLEVGLLCGEVVDVLMGVADVGEGGEGGGHGVWTSFAASGLRARCLARRGGQSQRDTQAGRDGMGRDR